ncbi:MAG: hypothetical protein KAS12_01555 [Candidatus Aenigmarchaeota archaeon]|nr:hypothetical protein [Candidatus Aenigmarchaeota archaeon]
MEKLDLSNQYFLNKSTILYGASNTGKSTLTHNILASIAKNIAIPLAIAPSEESNGVYEGIIPPQLIYKKINMDLMKMIWDRQESAARIYKNSRNLVAMRGIYLKVLNKEPTDVQKIYDILKRHTVSIEANGALSKEEKMTSKKLMLEKSDNLAIDVYRVGIIKNYQQFLEYQRVNKTSSTENLIIEYVNFNPNLLIMFDDATVLLKAFLTTDLGKEYFFRGRHVYITIIIAVHDDACVERDIRKNAHLSVFTNTQSMGTFFDRTTNNFDKGTKLMAKKIMAQAFGNSKFRKVIYERDTNKFLFHDLYLRSSPQPVGNKNAWKFCQKIARDVDVRTDNPFDKIFAHVNKK